MAKRFFYVCAGLLCLALVYHLGARTATAQAPGNADVAMTQNGGDHTVVTENGDVYTATSGALDAPWVPRANVFSGGPTPTTTQESFGSLKARYRGEREPQGVKPSTNR
jgi:hypothetical protein